MNENEKVREGHGIKIYHKEKERKYHDEKEGIYHDEKERKYHDEKERIYHDEKERKYHDEKERKYHDEKERIYHDEKERKYHDEKERIYHDEKERKYHDEKEGNIISYVEDTADIMSYGVGAEYHDEEEPELESNIIKDLLKMYDDENEDYQITSAMDAAKDRSDINEIIECIERAESNKFHHNIQISEMPQSPMVNNDNNNNNNNDYNDYNNNKQIEIEYNMIVEEKDDDVVYSKYEEDEEEKEYDDDENHNLFKAMKPIEITDNINNNKNKQIENIMPTETAKDYNGINIKYAKKGQCKEKEDCDEIRMNVMETMDIKQRDENKQDKTAKGDETEDVLNEIWGCLVNEEETEETEETLFKACIDIDDRSDENNLFIWILVIYVIFLGISALILSMFMNYERITWILIMLCTLCTFLFFGRSMCGLSGAILNITGCSNILNREMLIVIFRIITSIGIVSGPLLGLLVSMKQFYISGIWLIIGKNDSIYNWRTDHSWIAYQGGSFIMCCLSVIYLIILTQKNYTVNNMVNRKENVNDKNKNNGYTLIRGSSDEIIKRRKYSEKYNKAVIVPIEAYNDDTTSKVNGLQTEYNQTMVYGIFAVIGFIYILSHSLDMTEKIKILESDLNIDYNQHIINGNNIHFNIKSYGLNEFLLKTGFDKSELSEIFKNDIIIDILTAFKIAANIPSGISSEEEYVNSHLIMNIDELTEELHDAIPSWLSIIENYINLLIINNEKGKLNETDWRRSLKVIHAKNYKKIGLELNNIILDEIGSDCINKINNDRKELFRNILSNHNGLKISDLSDNNISDGTIFIDAVYQRKIPLKYFEELKFGYIDEKEGEFADFEDESLSKLAETKSIQISVLAEQLGMTSSERGRFIDAVKLLKQRMGIGSSPISPTGDSIDFDNGYNQYDDPKVVVKGGNDDTNDDYNKFENNNNENNDILFEIEVKYECHEGKIGDVKREIVLSVNKENGIFDSKILDETNSNSSILISKLFYYLNGSNTNNVETDINNKSKQELISILDNNNFDKCISSQSIYYENEDDLITIDSTNKIEGYGACNGQKLELHPIGDQQFYLLIQTNSIQDTINWCDIDINNDQDASSMIVDLLKNKNKNLRNQLLKERARRKKTGEIAQDLLTQNDEYKIKNQHIVSINNNLNLLMNEKEENKIKNKELKNLLNRVLNQNKLERNMNHQIGDKLKDIMNLMVLQNNNMDEMIEIEEDIKTNFEKEQIIEMKVKLDGIHSLIENCDEKERINEIEDKLEMDDMERTQDMIRNDDTSSHGNHGSYHSICDINENLAVLSSNSIDIDQDSNDSEENDPDFSNPLYIDRVLLLNENDDKKQFQLLLSFTTSIGISLDSYNATHILKENLYKLSKLLIDFIYGISAIYLSDKINISRYHELIRLVKNNEDTSNIQMITGQQWLQRWINYINGDRVLSEINQKQFNVKLLDVIKLQLNENDDNIKCGELEEDIVQKLIEIIDGWCLNDLLSHNRMLKDLFEEKEKEKE